MGDIYFNVNEHLPCALSRDTRVARVIFVQLPVNNEASGNASIIKTPYITGSERAIIFYFRNVSCKCICKATHLTS